MDGSVLPSWSRCFVCTSSVSLERDGRNNELAKGREEDDDLKLIAARRVNFLKYLIDVSPNASVDNSLINDIHRLLTSSFEAMSQVMFCSDCDKRAEVLLRLHLELEVVQMNIFDVVQNVKDICHWIRENEGFQKDLDSFGRRLKQLQEDSEVGIRDDVEERLRFLKIITGIQTSLSGISSGNIFTSYRYPKVILERCHRPHQKDAVKSIVKKEPEEEETHYEPFHQDDGDDSHFDDDGFAAQLENDEELNINDEKVNIKCNGDSLKTSDRKRKGTPEFSPAKSVKSKSKRKYTLPESFLEPSTESIRSITEQLLLNMKADVASEEIFRSIGKYHFTCLNNHCNFKTLVAITMDQHLRTHETSEKKFYCPDTDCKRSFTHKQHFVFHLQQHCSRNRRCILSDCDENLPVLQMEEHLKTHFKQLFSCDFCDFSFGNYPELIQHYRFHSRVELRCQLCKDSKLSKKRYKKRQDLRRHLYEDHKMKQLLLTCDFPSCTETFFDPHRKLVHANVHKKQYMCQVCSKCFISHTQLSTHIKREHKRQKQLLKSVEAAKRRKKPTEKTSSQILKKNTKTEAEKMLVKMEAEENCTKLFDALRFVGKEFFVCIICGYKAQKTWLIEQHFRDHETEEKCFHCPESSCYKSFTNKQIFVFHLQNHCVRKRKCGSCDIQLPILGMPEHLKTHHETVYNCQLCDFSFGNFKDLLSHGRHHSKANLKCQICTEPDMEWQLYPTRQLLLEHLFDYHKMEDLLLKCDQPDCTETFLDPLPKKVHFEKVHATTENPNTRKRRKRQSTKVPKVSKEKRKSSNRKIVLDTIVNPSAVERLLLKLEAEESSYEIFKSMKSNLYACLICKFNVTRAYVMDQHLRQHEKETIEEKSFHCPEPNCGKSFALKQPFVFHLQQHCARKRKCDCCELSLPVLLMEDHMKSHTDQIYYCQLCDYCFTNMKDLIVHCRYHKKASLKCQLCTEPALASQMYSNHNQLFQHMYEYHNKEEALLKCDYPNCTDTFFDAKKKKDHEDSHEGLNNCKTCGKSFTSSDSLSTHMKIHQNEKNVLCDQCPEGFRTKEMLKRHKIVLHGMQPYTCELCQDVKKQFTTIGGLRRHISVDHEQRRWKCSMCPKELPTKAGWIDHEQTHSTEKNFHCKTCDYATNALYSLKRHEKLHREKTFMCSYCPKAFAIKRYLNEHTMTHTQEQPFVCDLCGSRFNQRNSLSFHKKKKHGITRGRGKPKSFNNASASEDSVPMKSESIQDIEQDIDKFVGHVVR